jgi:hypothetical protein
MHFLELTLSKEHGERHLPHFAYFPRPWFLLCTIAQNWRTSLTILCSTIIILEFKWLNIINTDYPENMYFYVNAHKNLSRDKTVNKMQITLQNTQT